MNEDIRFFIIHGIVGLWTGGTLDWFGYSQAGVIVAVAGVLPILFIGFILFGLKADELFGVKDAWP